MAKNKVDKNVSKQCPWCEQWALKDAQCNHVICGRAGKGFMVGAGGNGASFAV